MHRHQSHLRYYFAAFYALLIIYSSLNPFSGWLAPLPDTPFFLFAPWSRFTWFDVAINALAYFPLGFFVAFLWSRVGWHCVFGASSAALLLSFVLETAQFYLPSRYASTIDIASNTSGALFGALLAKQFSQHPRWLRSLRAWRYHFFMRRRLGDLGLSLLCIWLLVQINPGIPLFGITFTTELATDRAGTVLIAAQTAFNLLGVGLLVAILLRRREHIGSAVLLLVGLALLAKATAAELLLKPSAWEHWLPFGVAFGMAAGCLALLCTIWLKRSTQLIICGIALCSAFAAAIGTPDLFFAEVPVEHFTRRFGHLLNFNDLTHTVLLLWPGLVSVYLLVLAGKLGRTRDV